MNKKIRNFVIPFILMTVINLGYYFLTDAPNFGSELNPHLGILFISGIFFGPYGCVGAVIGNMICDVVRGYGLPSAVLSAGVSLAISLFAYKLWYTNDFTKNIITRPRFNNSLNLIKLIWIIVVTGLLYSLLTVNISELVCDISFGFNRIMYLRYFINYVNFGLLFSALGILICKYYDFVHIPEKSNKKIGNEYKRILLLILGMIIADVLLDIFTPNLITNLLETAVVMGLIILYITKPITHLEKINYYSIPEKIMNNFILLTLLLLIINMLVITTPIQDVIFNYLISISADQQFFIFMLILDITLVLFFVPSLIFLTYIERKVIKPIKSFSKIEPFIKKDERIKTDELLDIYSPYIKQDDEIGTLSRSYTNLIQNNNEYIENLNKLETQKHRIIAELNIAHDIQQAILPVQAIDNNYITVKGYCMPAKAVGGDFYDYYEIDEDNTAIIIGDASGKGVPAALFTTITQYSIKLLVKNEVNPARVFNIVNNQICEENPAMMFITLFLGIYNNKTHILTYANAGHNPPIIKKDDGYEYLSVDSEIVMGVMDGYEYSNHEVRVTDEFILYTDGVTDTQNSNNQLYGEKRLINCLDNLVDDNIIKTIISDIDRFSEDEDQFDDVTILTLKVKK